MKTCVYVSGWRKGVCESGLCAYELNCVTGEMTPVDRVGQLYQIKTGKCAQ